MSVTAAKETKETNSYKSRPLRKETSRKENTTYRQRAPPTYYQEPQSMVSKYLIPRHKVGGGRLGGGIVGGKVEDRPLRIQRPVHDQQDE
jgi:hypothetical protein